MADTEKTVFIGYRRKVSSFIARAIFLDLRAHGYDVFMDVESIDSGTFDTIILNQIAVRAHFLVILTPGTLNRCVNVDDWLRKEIEHAMLHGRNIVPVLANDFKFNQKVNKFLVGKLEQLPRLNGLSLPHEYFDAAMERLRERYLKQPVAGASLVVSPEEQTIIEQKIEEVAKEPAPTAVELDAEIAFSQAYDKQQAGDTEGAIADYTEAIRLNPNFATAFFNRGLIRREKNNFDGAIADYTEAIRLNPNFAEAYSSRGLVRYKKNDMGGAIADYTEAIYHDPYNVIAYFNRGLVRREQGDMESAIRDYTEAIRLNPDHAKAYSNRGFARSEQGDMEGAIEDYTEAIRLSPDSVNAYVNRAEVYFVLKLYAEALVGFSKAEELQPNFKFAIAGMAISHHVMGDVEGAHRLWRRVIEEDQRYLDVEWVNAKLDWAEPLVEEAQKLIMGLGK